ncbi:MAG: hypothetical protein C4576_10350 [Desulfobacteraceae bacterium]|nr:MAG: hypothetical protein C4576_10350 [Desulfobacteraceae bacterium]
MFLDVSIITTLAIFFIGLVYKVSTWFRYGLAEGTVSSTGRERVRETAKGIARVVFSSSLLVLAKALAVDVILQIRILRESPFRWFMHILLCYGFFLLLFMHGFEKFFSQEIFPDYSSTLNPYLFLRDLAGIMVLAGLAMAAYRRIFSRATRPMTNSMDLYAIGILAVVILTGIFLEGVKIGSYNSFRAMEKEYADLGDDADLRALEGFWVVRFGVVSPRISGSLSPDVLAKGEEIHEMSCAGCHSSPGWAVAGFSVAKILQPFALGLDRIHFAEFLWYFHILVCFVGLSFLPFTKLFHILTTPLSLLVRAVMDASPSDSTNNATRRIMELDACTHCGACSLRCAAAMAYEGMGNADILPSEKIGSLRSLVRGKLLKESESRSLLEGLNVCTRCRRCSDVCPAGIDLQGTWRHAREALLKKGFPEPTILSPLSLQSGLRQDDMDPEHYAGSMKTVKQTMDRVFHCAPADHTHAVSGDLSFRRGLRLSVQGNTFSHCYSCRTCTSACPVLDCVDHPREQLGLLPHQVMRAAGLGLENRIFRSRMLWVCLGCYRCQEHCPQGVRVTDVFYELKNMAMARLKREPLNMGH